MRVGILDDTGTVVRVQATGIDTADGWEVQGDYKGVVKVRLDTSQGFRK